MNSFDVIIIGAGASGLSAGRNLIEAGKKILILEGRSRIGGRLFTRHPRSSMALEMGAEFIHGLP